MKTVKLENSLRRLVRAAAIVTLLTLLFSHSALALPKNDGFVGDDAGILDSETVSTVKNISDELFSKRRTRIAVCSVTGTDGKELRDLASEIYKDWQVGNGVLLLIVDYPDDSESTDTYYAVQSNSISDILTNSKLSEILNEKLEASFAEGDYSTGVAATVEELSSFLGESLPEDFGLEKKSGIPGWLSVILKIIVIVAILLIAGYAALIILERRQAERRRAYLEERRRMAREGRLPRRRPQYPTTSAPSQRGSMYPQSGRYESAAYPEDYTTSNNAQRNYRTPGSSMQPQPRQTNYGYGYTDNRRNPNSRGGTAPRNQTRYDEFDPKNAATVQINTADIRAALRNERNGRTNRSSYEYDDRDSYGR